MRKKKNRKIKGWNHKFKQCVSLKSKIEKFDKRLSEDTWAPHYMPYLSWDKSAERITVRPACYSMVGLSPIFLKGGSMNLNNLSFEVKDFGEITPENISQFIKDHKIDTGKFENIKIGDVFTLVNNDDKVKVRVLSMGFNPDIGYHVRCETIGDMYTQWILKGKSDKDTKFDKVIREKNPIYN